MARGQMYISPEPVSVTPIKTMMMLPNRPPSNPKMMAEPTSFQLDFSGTP